LGNIELTAAEVKRREMRAMRFQTNIPTIPTKALPTPKAQVTMTDESKTYTPLPWDTKALPDAVKPKKKPYSRIQWDVTTLPDVPAMEVVGTSTALEKPYFRLTSVSVPHEITHH
jgi:hypothetical protein